jgi:glycosyltransferase involved in cell wall biosynthesis
VRYFMGSGDAWIANGTRARNELLRLGANRARIVVSPLTARPPGTARRRRTRRPDSPPRFLYVGQLIERKGIKLLLEAFGHLDEGELRLAGTGRLQEYVAEAARTDPRIVPLGHLTWDELEAEYDATDAVVLPSLYEVWGLVINEAFARGLPVIVSDQVGAVDDLVVPSVNGIVFESGSVSSLTRALRDVAAWAPAQRERCEAVARAMLDTWSIDDAAEAHIRAGLLGVEHRWR